MPPVPSIENEDAFYDYLVMQGVGQHDQVEGATPRSYISYLKSASTILNRPVSRQLFPNLNQEDFENVCAQIRNSQTHAQYAAGTRRNAVSAMRHYFNMVAENNL